jgi:hypothetical protein
MFAFHVSVMIYDQTGTQPTNSFLLGKYFYMQTTSEMYCEALYHKVCGVKTISRYTALNT